MSARSSSSTTLTDAQINYDLARTIKSGESSVPGYKFDRTFVHCEPGIITITVQRSMWDMPMYSSVSYRPVVKNGVFTAEVASMRFGRLGVDPRAKALGDFVIGIVLKAFNEDAKLLGRLANVTVGEGTITFTTKPLP